MKKINNFELLILLLYVLIYKFILISKGNLIQYIINPLIWILLSLYFFVKYYKREEKNADIIHTVISSSLLYSIILYSIGIFVGYSKNPYSITLNSIIINFFSILLILVLKEFIRSILVNNIKKNIYYLLVFIIFFIYDINVLNIIKPFNTFSDLLKRFVEDIVPFVSINMFMIYLCKKNGYLSAAVYRVIIILPTLLIPIYPKVEPIILTIFNVIFPFFTYLIIRSNINKKDRIRVPRISRKYTNIWIGSFILSIILVLFAIGAFPIKGAVILTESMKPVINPGDMVIIQECKFKDVKVQDVIQYKLKDFTVVHRVVEIDYYKKVIITKGDNNPNIDKPVSSKQIIGKVNYKIPYIGYPTYIFQKMIGKKVNFGE